MLSEEDIVSGRAISELFVAKNSYEAVHRRRTDLKTVTEGMDGLLNAISPSAARLNGNNSSC